jgi:formylglycine-generating enzyme required for sulfatase activity
MPLTNSLLILQGEALDGALQLFVTLNVEIRHALFDRLLKRVRYPFTLKHGTQTFMSSRKDLIGGAAFIVAVGLLDNFVFIERTVDHTNMIWLEPNSFVMGSEQGLADESPAHTLNLSGFWMDKFEVTNGEFEEFTEATGYTTYSEQVGDSLVFSSPQENHAMRTGPLDWWGLVEHADWQTPEGDSSSIEDKLDHPVVQVNYDDANAYCQWQDKELPSEAQFEYAARGGKTGTIYSWGDEPLHVSGKVSNTWQGNFPLENDAVDGYLTTAPVGSFPANDFGFYDLTGNVWEWVQDWYHPQYYAMSPSRNPAGVAKADSMDPNEPETAKRSVRGGSFLCADNYCSGFRLSARMPADPSTATNHTGFRCVVNQTGLSRFVGL